MSEKPFYINNKSKTYVVNLNSNVFGWRVLKVWIIKTEQKGVDGNTTAVELESVDRMFDIDVRWDGAW